MSIAIVVLTNNRLELLRQCVENVLARTSSETQEIVVWNNASTDGTRSFLDSLDDPRIRVLHHPRNIGQNAYAEAFASTEAEFMIELDDDVIDAPQDWDRTLRDAYRRLPQIGFLAADLVENPGDRASYDRYHNHRFHAYEVDGIALLEGPTGGWCAITSRELYDRVGGMPHNPKKIYFLEDAEYIRRIGRLGFRRAILDDLHVVHAGGSLAETPTGDKAALLTEARRRQARRDAVKRVLLVIPFVGRLNDRFGWFERPDSR
jgi:GT2 family glycosyltransferase